MPDISPEVRERALERYDELDRLARAAHATVSALFPELQELRTRLGREEHHFQLLAVGGGYVGLEELGGLAYALFNHTVSDGKTTSHSQSRKRAETYDTQAAALRRLRDRVAARGAELSEASTRQQEFGRARGLALEALHRAGLQLPDEQNTVRWQ